MLNTLESERYARSALLYAFAEELGAAVSEAAPESTRTLLARAKTGELPDDEIPTLLDELRASLVAA